MIIKLLFWEDFMEIRFANKEDLEAIIALEQECFPKEEAATPASLTQRYAAFSENFLVAVIDGKVVGFINGCTYSQPCLPDSLYEDTNLHTKEGMYMTVFGLDVSSQYRKQGIAKKLLEAYIDVAKTRNKKGVVLTCKDHLKPFYESMGFKDKGVSVSTHGNATWNDMVLLF